MGTYGTPDLISKLSQNYTRNGARFGPEIEAEMKREFDALDQKELDLVHRGGGR